MIKKEMPTAEVVRAVDVKAKEREIRDCQIIAAGGSGIPTDILKTAENLQWIQAWSAGVNHFTKPDLVQFLIDNNIKLTTTSGIHGNIIAEHVMGMVISFSRSLMQLYQQQKNNVWRKIKVSQLEGKTMAVIGVGSIGLEIAERAKAFKMKTIGIKRTVNNSLPYIDELYSNDELLTVLNRSDYVVVTLPLTDETTAMFSEDEFNAMKKTAYFINIGRGQVVDEEEMILALEEGKIAGAGLDVFEKEPLPGDSPLYRLDNVLLTPHISGVFPDYNKKAVKVFIDNLNRYKQGKELINLVDYNRGY